MVKSIKRNFYKSKSCPSANTLLSFAANETTDKIEWNSVSKHLSKCEFCSAELHLLALYPPDLEKVLEEKVLISEMPFQLRQLAETALSDEQRNFRL
jgi:hypothetical protein